jgi:hypothetical protein
MLGTFDTLFHVGFSVILLTCFFFQILTVTWTTAHNQLRVSEVTAASGGNDDMFEKITSQQQAQQAWADAATKNCKIAVVRESQLALGDNKSDIGMQQV